MNFTEDNRKAFEEVFAVSGKTVQIDGVNVRAIVPFSKNVIRSMDEMGAFNGDESDEITVLTADIPSINRDSVVILEGDEYRINGLDQNGTISTSITLEAP
jgi:hypothetical protein